jgi:hypothetical protein
MPAARKPGRPAIGERALVAQVFARLTSQQHDRYLALGGAKWLRQQLDLAEGRQRLTPEPTAHNPFPAAPGPGEHAPDLQYLRGRSAR